MEFLETFEMHHNIKNPGSRDGIVTFEEFTEYYTNVSASIDRDDYFALMMNNSWNLSGDSTTYHHYNKGWANAAAGSPGKPPSHYVKGARPQLGYSPSHHAATDMVVQRTGMTSSDNPLSTTTKHYHSKQVAERGITSLSNPNRTYAEPSRTHYQVAGEESKTNPFGQQTKQYYTDKTGKPVQEQKVQPQPPMPKYQQMLLDRFRQKLVARGGRGIIGLSR